MARSNVLVSYAPAAAASAHRSTPARVGGLARFAPSVAAVLLTGVTMVTVTHFLLGDSNTARPEPAPNPLPPPSVNWRGSAERFVLPSLTEGRGDGEDTLPLLGLVQKIEPEPLPAARPLPARPITTVRQSEIPRSAVRSSPPPPPAILAPAALAIRAEVPDEPPPAGQRRDLEGFLQEQGLELVASPEPADAATSETEGAVDQIAPLAMVEPPAALAGALAQPVADESAISAATDNPEAVVEIVEPSLPTAKDLASPRSPDETKSARLAERASITEPARGQTIPVPPARPAAATAGRSGDTDLQQPPAASVAQSFPVAVMNGKTLGAVTLRHSGRDGDMIHLGALLGLLQLRMPDAQLSWLATSAAADQFVTFDRLRAAGITIQHDPKSSRLLIDAR